MKSFINSLALATLVCFSLSTTATPLLNPEPSALLDDIDGTGYFTPTNSIFAVEVLDIGELLAGVGNSFGFFFEGADVTDNNNLFTVFSANDLNNEEAVINFNLNIVVDVEDNAVETVFSGSGNIGFFLTLNNFGGSTLFSDESLNGGNDTFGTFPFIADNSRLALSFQAPNTTDFVGIHVINGATPTAVTVPVPSSLLMMIIGLASLARAIAGRKITISP